MSSYYVDGYNLLFATDLGTLSLEAGREQLLDRLASFATVREVVVVFDGKESSRTHRGALEIAFGRCADGFILTELGAKAHPEEWCVVSSDRGLCKQARELKAATLSPKPFWAKVKATTKTPKRHSIPDREIERWLEIFENRLKNID